MLKKNNEINQIRNSLALASSILIFHVALLVGIGVLILFFSGLVNYIFWIFLGGVGLVAGTGYLFYRRMKKDGGAAVLNILSHPELQGKTVEVNFLGGLASVKIAGDARGEPQGIDGIAVPLSHRLEDADSQKIRELTELARMLEKNLLTPEEYQHIKKRLLNSHGR